MELIKETTNALKTVAYWMWMIYTGFCDFIGISEWAVLFISITIIGLIIGIPIYIRRK